MRHPYTPVFRDFLTSSMWATDPATRCVWIWFLLMADPEGFVVGTVPGVAQQAGVTLEQAKTAVDLLEGPDPYSSTPDFDGRRVVKVPRGWHIVNFVTYRERAKLEAEKARKRTWAQKKRSTQLELPFPTLDSVDAASTCVDSSETLDAPKPKPKLSPEVVVVTPAREGFDNQELPVIPFVRRFHDLEGLDDAGLEDEAVLAGMTREWFRERLAAAKNLASIGGQAGVRDQREWVRQQFGNWKTWGETARAKDAQRQAALASPVRFAGGRTPMPELVANERQRAFAEKHGVDLPAIMKGIQEDDIAASLGLGRAKEVIGERLTIAAKQKKEGAEVTGKLTSEQARKWSSPPTGGHSEMTG